MTEDDLTRIRGRFGFPNEVQLRLIQRALDRTDHNVSAAARLLGISRDTLRYRLERMGLREPGGESGNDAGPVTRS